MPKLGNFVQSVYREESSTTGTLIESLCKASAEFLPVALDQDGVRGGAGYRYASIKSIRRATQSALARHGLWLNHVYSHNDQGCFCITVLRHTCGEYITSTLMVPVRDDIQEAKAAMTLLCRTAIEGLLAICTEEDDDGQCCVDGDAEKRSQWKTNFDLAVGAIAKARNEEELDRFVGLASQRIKDGLMSPDAMGELKQKCEERSQFLKKEKTSANGSRTVGDQGPNVVGGGSVSSDRGQRKANGTGRTDVRSGDAGNAVAAR